MLPLDHRVSATMAVAPTSRVTLQYCLLLIRTLCHGPALHRFPFPIYPVPAAPQHTRGRRTAPKNENAGRSRRF